MSPLKSLFPLSHFTSSLFSSLCINFTLAFLSRILFHVCFFISYFSMFFFSRFVSYCLYRAHSFCLILLRFQFLLSFTLAFLSRSIRFRGHLFSHICFSVSSFSPMAVFASFPFSSYFRLCLPLVSIYHLLYLCCPLRLFRYSKPSEHVLYFASTIVILFLFSSPFFLPSRLFFIFLHHYLFAHCPVVCFLSFLKPQRLLTISSFLTTFLSSCSPSVYSLTSSSLHTFSLPF